MMRCIARDHCYSPEMLRFLGVLTAIVLAGCASGGGETTPGADSSVIPGADGGPGDGGTDGVVPGCDPTADTCPPSQYCSAVTKSCLEGCRLDTGCPSAKPHCDVLSHQCVGCLTTDQCPTGQACSDHVCVPGCSTTRPCDAGGTCCAGACVDVKSNAENCSACAAKCVAKNGIPVCTGGTCSIGDCGTAFADCNKKYDDGCEVVLDNDPKNCGKCGVVCGSANGSASCAAGACKIACAPDFGNCNGKLDDGCEVDLRTDPKNCGKCGAAPVEVCNGVDDDCDGKPDEAFACVRGSATRACTASCGSAGTQACSDTCTLSSCNPPAETCNATDDDCNGLCDDLDGCRKGIHRSYSATTGEHFYTDSSVEAACCGFALEFTNYYYLYTSTAPGLTPFYRCYGGSPGTHLYTTDASCEGVASMEGSMGFIATTPRCGSTPLYKLYRAVNNDHFYTTSDGERASASAGGYVDQGIIGYVWTGPRG